MLCWSDARAYVISKRGAAQRSQMLSSPGCVADLGKAKALLRRCIEDCNADPALLQGQGADLATYALAYSCGPGQERQQRKSLEGIRAYLGEVRSITPSWHPALWLVHMCNVSVFQCMTHAVVLCSIRGTASAHVFMLLLRDVKRLR